MKILHVGLSAELDKPNGFQNALNKHYECSHIGISHGDINGEIRRRAYTMHPDLVFMQIQTPDVIHKDTVKYLRSIGAFVINWMGDIRTEFPEWTASLGKYTNLTCFSNMNYVEELRDRGITSDYLQIGYDHNIYNPFGPKIYDAEIVFFGNNYNGIFPLSKFREEMVDFLKRHYDNFKVYGGGWKYNDGDYMNNPDCEAGIYRGSKIAINLSHFDYKRCSSSRLYKILGCGAFCLTRSYPEIEKDFENFKDIVIWDNLEDLKIKIDYFLEDEIYRKEASKSGHIKASNNFTYEKMVDNIDELYLKYK